RNLEKVVSAALEKEYAVFITADHGNIEELYTKEGKPHVAHTTNKVRFFALDGRKGAENPNPTDGALSDVAPTILHAMGIERPDEMTGHSLTPSHEYGKDRKAILVILDGWGEGKKDGGDAIFSASTPYWDFLLSNTPSSLLNASGEAVGLGKGKSGNSEAGHMNIGGGRTVVQDDIRIDNAIKNGEFDSNPVIRAAIERTKEKGGALHLITYLTYRSSHGSMDYGVKIASMSHQMGQDNVFLHIIFDGRSTENGSAPKLLEELEEKLDEIGTGYIVDGIGRGLVLDRDKNYDRVKMAYDLFTSF
ncbi:MAG: hypothetical protein ACI4S4_04835, partial [Candidatus Ornithospirochaeta sp.]